MDQGEEAPLLGEQSKMLDPGAVPTRRKIVQVGSGVLFCLLMVGLVFGFAALKPILVDSGVYAELCPNGQAPCAEQDTRLNLLFIVASSVNNIAALPMGAFLDRAGPKITTMTGGVLFAAGCATFAVGHVKGWLDTYLAGFTLLALGSPAVFLAQFHLSNTFPARSGLILGALTGAFDASSLPLCFYKLAYFAIGHKPSLWTFWLSYTAVPILLIAQQLAFGPSQSYLRPAPEPTPAPPERPSPRVRRSASGTRRPSASRRMSSSFSRRSYGIPDAAEDHEIKQLLDKRDDGITGALFGRGVAKQILSSWWLVMEVMVIIHMTRINWYLATVNTQLVFYTGAADVASKLTDAFIFLLPLGGIVSIPFIGWLLDHRPTLDVVVLMAVMGLAFGVLTLQSTVAPQLVGIGFIVVFRPLFYTAISDYAAKVFGFETFGTVYGLSMTVSGLFGLLLTPLDRVTKGRFHGSYTPVNLGLLALGLSSTLVLAARVWTYTRQPKGRIRLISVDSDAILEEDEDA